MNEKLTKIFNDVKVGFNKNSPAILTGIGITGMLTSTVLAVKATPKALKLLDQAENNKCDELTTVEKIKAAWKPYIPAAISSSVSIACLIGANSAHAKRNAALATAYKISESALTDYRSKVIETVGEKKEKTIREKVDKERLQQAPVSKNEVIVTSNDNTLCFDAISGRYFTSDIEKLKKAENELNKRMLSEMYISLNEFYNEIGLSGNDIGNNLGWNIDDGLIDLHFSSQLADDGRPCVVVDYHIAPRYGYEKLS